ncbi:MAG: hypothetical protein CVT95_12065 [Bacteroidetes bacterium HGW-Bacteroidetes-12]|nr:MAG: hypothetical protein CVT95_12065 [Bacteroidetes bacterium HGW-Bacteroidetes-12]
MKKLIFIAILAIIFSSCRKDWPEPDIMSCGGPIYYTNYYILNKIDAEIIAEKDTIKYNDFFIQLDLSGYLVSENTYYTEVNIEDDPNPYAVEPVEQKYFINKLGYYDVCSDKKYNDNTYSYNNKIRDISVFFRNKKQQYFRRSYDEELGYTPHKLYLTEPPDTSKWISFTVKLIDTRNNRFVATTDSVFITK